MERYIDHALSFRWADTLRTTGHPKRRNETPNPKVRHVTTWRTTNWGSCVAVGSGKRGGSEVGQRMGPTTIAATAATRVTATTLVRVPLPASSVPLAAWAVMFVLLPLALFTG
jgi:hypothetical protein